MVNTDIFSAVLRITDVEIARTALETALGATLERYEPTRTGTSHYAQLFLSIEGDFWESIAKWIEALGPELLALRRERLIGSTCIDLAVSFAENKMSLSVTIPGFVAKAMGSYDIDIELSVYLVSEAK